MEIRIDIEICRKCGGAVKVIACIEDPVVIEKILTHLKVLSATEIGCRPAGEVVHLAGLVITRQRPGKGNAVFITLEDETGILNLIVWRQLA